MKNHSVSRDEAKTIAEEKQKLTAVITKWSERIKKTRKHDIKFRKRWAEDRRLARGETEWLVDTNLIGAIMEVLAAFLYAKNPDISASPSASVGRERVPDYRKVAQTLQIIVSRVLKDAGLKRIAKRWVRGSMTVGIGWIKAAMQTRTEPNVMVVNRINDLTDQHARLETLQIQESDPDGRDPDVLKAEISAQIIALEAEREQTISEGAVLDLFPPEDVVIAAECGEIENYLNAPFICFDMYKSYDEALQETGWSETEELDCLKGATRFMQRAKKSDSDSVADDGESSTWEVSDDSKESQDGFLRFMEIWSKTDGVVYTMIEGVNTKWAKEPFAPITGKRWYPCFDLVCHPIDGERYPQSDVHQLKRLQDEYGSTRSKFALHRRRAVPGVIFDKSAVTEESVRALADSEVQEYVGVDMTTPGQDIRTAFAPKVYNPIDPRLYDTQQITVEMEKVSGAQDALQSAVQTEKTATEAKIQEQGFGARSGARRDTLEDSLTDLAQYISQLCLQLFDQADAIKYAGPEAVWVEMTTEEAMMLFDLEIKAGSTGKPKANSDRELWGTLMPLIERMIDRVGQARIMNQEWAAKPWIALIEETMQRLDDPADIEKFLPVPPPPPPDDGTSEEPTEVEKADIESKQSSAFKDRATGIEKMAEALTMQQALDYLFNGGKYVPPAPEPAPQGQQAMPEAPDPLLN